MEPNNIKTMKKKPVYRKIGNNKEVTYDKTDILGKGAFETVYAGVLNVAVKRLHYKQECVHRDIKPQNVLLTKQGNIKIAGFNCAKFTKDSSQNQYGTPIYTAPQAFNDESYSSKCDVWSVGCLIYEMLTRQKLFAKGTTMFLLRKQHSLFKQPSKKAQMLKEIQNQFWNSILSKMLTYEDQDRPTFSELFCQFQVENNNKYGIDIDRESEVKQHIQQNLDNRNQYDIKRGKRQMKMKQQNQKIALTNRIKELENANRSLQVQYQQLLQNYSQEIDELTNQKMQLEKKLKDFQMQQNNKHYQIQQYVIRFPKIHPGISILKRPTKIGYNKQYCYNENINQLGRGTFGTVYQCYKQSNPSQKLAVKVFKDKLHQIKQQQRKYFQGEQKALNELKQHDNILKLIEFYVDPSNKIYLIFEKCDRSLAKQIQQTKKQHQKKVFQYFKEIVSAMKYMIDKHFIHRDLKPQNILIKNNHVKIADFGLAKLIEGNQEQSKTYFGTPLYQSPQLLHGKKYTSKCDVWAVGCIIFQMLTGHRLFNNFTELQETIKQRSSPHQTQIKNELKHFTPFWQKLILQMLCYKQDDRKSFAEVEKMLLYIEANCELFKRC